VSGSARSCTGWPVRSGCPANVGNDESGVLLEAEGDPASVRRFLAELAEHPPALAVVERVEATEIR